MAAAFIALVAVGEIAKAVSSAFGSYWFGVGILVVSAALLVVAVNRLRGLAGYEYAALIAGFPLTILIAGMTYAAIAGYPLS